jgi:hypothetical protein
MEIIDEQNSWRTTGRALKAAQPTCAGFAVSRRFPLLGDLDQFIWIAALPLGLALVVGSIDAVYHSAPSGWLSTVGKAGYEGPPFR